MSYYRHCLPPLKIGDSVKSAAEILQPLYKAATQKLPPKTSFKSYWEQNKSELETSFQNAKKLLLNACRLTYPDPGLPLAITCDASQKAIGCVLEQHDGRHWRPLSFFSKHLDESRQKWTTFKRELYALHQGVRYFHKQFGGRTPILFTDHRALIGSFGNPNLQTHDPVAHNQIVELGQWTTDIRYLPARSNPVSDFLSRPPDPVVEEPAIDDVSIAHTTLCQCSSIQALKNVITIKQIAEAQKECTDTFNHRQGLHPRNTTFNSVNYGEHELICEVTGKPRPILPKSLRNQALKQFHFDHCGHKELTRRVAENFFWTNLKDDCIQHVKFCHPCQSAKPVKIIKPPIGTFPVPTKRFSEVHVDVVGPLPISKGMKYILTCHDRSSRWTEALPMSAADAKTVADTFVAGWTQRFGACQSIFSDNGNTFRCDIWRQLNEALGTQVKYVPPFHQATNGAVERTHQEIKNSLKAILVEMADEKRESWMDYLPYVMLGRRASVQADLQASPAEYVFGEPLTIPGTIADPTQPPLSNIQDILKKVQKNY